MDPNERQEEQFDIEDIIREFTQKDVDADEWVRQRFPGVPKVQLPGQPPCGDTVRIELKQEAPEVPAAEKTAVFTPVAVQEPDIPPEEPAQMEELTLEEPPLPPEEAEAEPFSAEWEPEYEEPMGEFEAKAPIPFPAKNRTRLLREKLVAGPEKRYQDLSAAGLSGLQVGIFLQLLLFAVASIYAVMLEMGAVGEKHLQMVLFVQLVIVLLSGLLGCNRLLGGMGSLLRKQFTLNTLLCASFVACVADAYFCMAEQRVSIAPLFCLQMLMAQLSACEQRATEMHQMDTLRKANDLTAVVKIDKFYQERPGYASVPGEPESFMKNYALASAPEKALRKYGLLTLLISAAAGAYAGWQFGVGVGAQVLAAGLTIGMPASAFISMTRPVAIVHKRLHGLGAVLCGWYGIRYAEKNAVYPVTNEDLFPADGIKMNGVKFYGSVDPGWVTSSAVALLAANGSGMQRLFEQLPRGRDGLNQLVEDLTVYDGGLSGLVSAVPTLLGTAEFMQEMGIDLPEKNRIPDAVYVAVNEELSGVYAVSYPCDKASVAGLRNLCGWRSLLPVMVSNDFMLTPRFIREKLSVKVRRLAFPEREVRQTLGEIRPTEEAPVVALTTNPGLAAKTYALNGAWALRSAMSTGANIHMLAGMLGLLMVVVLMLLGGIEMLTATNLLLYTAIWLVPGWLVTEWTRYI